MQPGSNDIKIWTLENVPSQIYMCNYSTIDESCDDITTFSIAEERIDATCGLGAGGWVQWDGDGRNFKVGRDPAGKGECGAGDCPFQNCE